MNASRTGLQVLVVEPDQAERTRLRAVIRRVADKMDTALDVVEARNGTTALALCSETSFALVVGEVLLEGLSGLALVRKLSATKGGPPVILVTTMSRETDRYWGLRNGALAYFPKPYDEGSLADRVKRALTESRPKSDRPVPL